MVVYFKDLSETVIEERPVYSVVFILSNFGGLLGLYLGFSVLTVLELVDFGFDFIEYIRIKGKLRAYKKFIEDQKKIMTNGN